MISYYAAVLRLWCFMRIIMTSFFLRSGLGTFVQSCIAVDVKALARQPRSLPTLKHRTRCTPTDVSPNDQTSALESPCSSARVCMIGGVQLAIAARSTGRSGSCPSHRQSALAKKSKLKKAENIYAEKINSRVTANHNRWQMNDAMSSRVASRQVAQ